MHTNLDNIYLNGVNSKICEQLGLGNTQILVPKNIDNNRIGAGMIGTLANAMDPNSFLDFVKNSMGTACIRHTKDFNHPIQKVAVCGGSGSFLLNQAMAQGAHAFVSADFKYHEFFDAEDKILIADIGHYESEQFTIQLLFDLITNKFTNFAPYCTETVTNPINYY
jgi:putative NIF3 family GTP cyclohydrolase 1 type 2